MLKKHFNSTHCLKKKTVTMTFLPFTTVLYNTLAETVEKNTLPPVLGTQKKNKRFRQKQD